MTRRCTYRFPGVPEHLEECEVGEVDQKPGKDQRGHDPSCALRRVRQRQSSDHASGDQEQRSGEDLDCGVQRQGEEPAADPGQKKLQRDLLRCFDGKMVHGSPRSQKSEVRIIARGLGFEYSFFGSARGLWDVMVSIPKPEATSRPSEF